MKPRGFFSCSLAATVAVSCHGDVFPKTHRHKIPIYTYVFCGTYRVVPVMYGERNIIYIFFERQKTSP